VELKKSGQDGTSVVNRIMQSDRKRWLDLILKNGLLLATVFGSAIIVIIITIIFISGIKPFLPNYEFGQVNFVAFITGMKWAPGSNLFGIGYMIINTLYITLLAILLIVPISILTALFIAKVAPKPLANLMRTVVEILASIPSVIFGLFGSVIIVTSIDRFAKWSNQLLLSINKLTNGWLDVNPIETVAGLSTLATVLVLSMMIFPTITSIAETSIRSVPLDIEQASLALGATKTQTHFKVTLTSAKSGIFAGVILGVGRALGEATAVSLVAGNLQIGPSFNLFAPTQTLTTAMLIGIHESSGVNYDIRFSVALVLMVLILIVNGILNLVKEKVGNIHA
jgi:phosphate transport system permease protein